MTRIIVDSTCDLPKELLERFSIAVLRLSVTIDEATYRDGAEIQLESIYAAMRAGKIPKTSQIQWEDAKELFTSVAQSGDDIIFLAFSSAMSGTFNLANMVCTSIKEEYPDRHIAVIDSKGGSMGTGLIAIQLGMMNEKGASYDPRGKETRHIRGRRCDRLQCFGGTYGICRKNAGSGVLKPDGFNGL